MTRLRDLVPVLGRLSPGLHNAITDVPGVRVGHVTLISGDGALKPGAGPIRTGVTAILPHEGDSFREKVSAAVYTINGYGKACGFEQVRERGVIETPIILTNTLNVPRAADALISHAIRHNPQIGISTSTVNPLVGECNDGFLNDIQGRHVRPEHVWGAIESAAGGAIEEGCVGAGTGTACFHFKGGIGTASRIAGDYTLGVLVQTNFGDRPDLMVLGVPVGQHLSDTYLPQTGPGSVMIVLATDVPLDSRQLGRLTRRVSFGLARTGSVCHDGSGDFVIAFSTVNRWPHEPQQPTVQIPRLQETSAVMDTLFLAVVECVEEAVLNSLIAAHTTTGRDDHTLHALPHDTLVELLQHYRRIP